MKTLSLRHSKVLRRTVLSLSLILTGCQHYARSPLGKEPTRADFQMMTTPAEILEPAPSKPLQAMPPPLPAVYKTPLSLHLSSDVCIGAALEQVAAFLGIDIQIDENLRSKTLSISATQKPFVDILENLCSLAKLRYRMSGNILFIEPDTCFTRSYNVQFLNLVRSSENRISSGTDIFSHSVSGYGCAPDGTVAEGVHRTTGENGSNTSVSMTSQNDFWKEVEVNLSSLLNNANGPSPFSIHRQAGLISVSGTSEQHFRVKEYLEALRKAVSSQILIEAKVVEVDLHDNFKNGIDWGILSQEHASQKDDFFGGRNFTQSLEEKGNSSLSGLNVASGFIQYTTQFSGGLTAIFKTLQHFGSTRTLSSPRLTVLNNQSAVLKVARNHVYFKLNYSKHFYTKSDHEDISVGSDIQTVPIGLVMSVQPAIDPVNKSVILFLRPTISRMVTSVEDPSVAIASRSYSKDKNTTVPTSQIPVIEVKEVDSVLRLKDNEVAILGGLMETHSTHERYKNPLLGDVPVVKEAFSSLKRDDKVTEVVILIRVKILDSVAPDPADKRLVHLYTNDPRPIV